MKKIQILLLTAALMMTAAFAAGCGSNGGDGGDAELGNKYGTLFSSFSARDLQGNTRDEALITESDYTLVYLWATDCPPCVDSMPKLQAIQEAYQDKGVGILGIVLDLQDASGERLSNKVADAIAVTEGAGVTFPNIDLPPAIREMVYNEIQYTPTAFFVDQSGTIVSELYIGAYEVEKWSEIIDGLLEE